LTSNKEEIVATKSENFQYTVDLEVMDMPLFCQQSINMFSNSVDFMTVEPIDHGVETIVVKQGVTKRDRKKFDSWWNYHRNIQHKLKERKALTVDASNNSQGVMIVLEAEEITFSLDSLTDLNDSLTKSLEEEGLTVLSSISFEKESLVITLKEGYVMLRSWAEHKYCAFDLVLWNRLDKLDTVKDGLVATVGAELTSSYRIVTGGMKGIAAVEVPKYPAEDDSDSSAKTGRYAPVPTAFELGDLDTILKETRLLAQRADSNIVIFCPRKEKPCQSLEALKDGEKVLPIYASGESTKRDIVCENTTLDVMKSAIFQSKIITIVIDPVAPSKMGQVLKKVFSILRTREEVPAQFVLLAPGLDSSKPWYSSLFEWFRTDIVTLSPSHHAKVLFSSPVRSGKLRMSIFSAGNVDFYPHLVEFTEICERKFGLETEIPHVLDGQPKKMTCSDPPIVANESSYDTTNAVSQWESQNPLGMQTVSQFESGVPRGPLSVGERVLGSIDQKIMSGRWFPATVIGTNKDGSFNLQYDNKEVDEGIRRHFIRKLVFADNLTVEEVILVLVEEEDEFDYFYFGEVLEKMPNKKYKVNIHSEMNIVSVVKQKDIATLPASSEISCTTLKAMLQKAVASIYSTGKDKLEIQSAGDGCIATALWSQGSAVATWDGGSKLDLNLFTFEEVEQIHENFVEAFLELWEDFGRTFHNQQPRGSGRVVNFKHEMKISPKTR